jgi:hypothetical protein
LKEGVLFGIMGALGPELFKTNVRYTGASLGYQLSAAVGGGLTPIIATLLVRAAGGAYWPAPAYLAGLAAISLLTVILTPETRDRSLISSDGESATGSAAATSAEIETVSKTAPLSVTYY